MADVGWVMLVVGPIAVLLAGRPRADALISVLIGGGILLWARPWSPDRHATWVVRVEPEPADVALGRSFDPYFIPECRCGWDDPYYDDPDDARAEADKHAKGRVEPDFRQRFGPVED
jgi:hypothetical protein